MEYNLRLVNADGDYTLVKSHDVPTVGTILTDIIIKDRIVSLRVLKVERDVYMLTQTQIWAVSTDVTVLVERSVATAMPQLNREVALNML